MFGLVTKRDLEKELYNFRLLIDVFKEEVITLRAQQKSNELKIATLEALILNTRPLVSKADKSSKVETFESKVISKIRKNKKSAVLSEILKLIDTHSTLEIYDLIVKQKGLCSKASFYRYLEGIKSNITEGSITSKIQTKS